MFMFDTTIVAADASGTDTNSRDVPESPPESRWTFLSAVLLLYITNFGTFMNLSNALDGHAPGPNPKLESDVLDVVYFV